MADLYQYVFPPAEHGTDGTSGARTAPRWTQCRLHAASTRAAAPDTPPILPSRALPIRKARAAALNTPRLFSLRLDPLYTKGATLTVAQWQLARSLAPYFAPAAHRRTAAHLITAGTASPDDAVCMRTFNWFCNTYAKTYPGRCTYAFRAPPHLDSAAAAAPPRAPLNTAGGHRAGDWQVVNMGELYTGLQRGYLRPTLDAHRREAGKSGAVHFVHEGRECSTTVAQLHFVYRMMVHGVYDAVQRDLEAILADRRIKTTARKAKRQSASRDGTTLRRSVYRTGHAPLLLCAPAHISIPHPTAPIVCESTLSQQHGSSSGHAPPSRDGDVSGNGGGRDRRGGSGAS